MSASRPSAGDGGGTLAVLPCGHRLTVPWGLSVEAAAAELLRHQSECELDPGLPPFARHPVPPDATLGTAGAGP